MLSEPEFQNVTRGEQTWRFHDSGTGPAVVLFHGFTEYIEKYKIPVLTTPLDTLGSVVKISRIEVKINTRTPWKAVRAIELIKKHVNLNSILESSLLR